MASLSRAAVYARRPLTRTPFCTPPRVVSRFFHSTPFGDGLEPAQDDDLGLADFAHYVPAETAGKGPASAHGAKRTARTVANEEDARMSCDGDWAVSPDPVIIHLKLTDPYLNLAIEDYLFVQMPQTALRLFMYTNRPCVVIGKNQNPWKEVNMKALTTLGVPLVRRRSGGGTVVHDKGNLNYCLMTPQAIFDRMRFSRVVAESANSVPGSKYQLATNLRGDIVTAGENPLKVGGSAFRLLRGKSYHHGTLLLSLRLDVMRSLLAQTPDRGIVVSPGAVESVPAHVANILLDADHIMSAVGRNFLKEYDTDEATTITIDENTMLPQKVVEIARELCEWDWIYGHTPKFTHQFTHRRGFAVECDVGKHAILEQVRVIRTDENNGDYVRAQQLFELLQEYISENQLKYCGSNVAGFVTDDDMSEWIGTCIDGTH